MPLAAALLATLRRNRHSRKTLYAQAQPPNKLPRMVLPLVIIAWLYVTLLMAVAEAASPAGTLLGAAITFVFYGLLPAGIIGYILATPARKRARRAREQAQMAAYEAAHGAASGTDPDARGHASGTAQGGGVAPVREEP